MGTQQAPQRDCDPGSAPTACRGGEGVWRQGPRPRSQIRPQASGLQEPTHGSLSPGRTVGLFMSICPPSQAAASGHLTSNYSGDSTGAGGNRFEAAPQAPCSSPRRWPWPRTAQRGYRADSLHPGPGSILSGRRWVHGVGWCPLSSWPHTVHNLQAAGSVGHCLKHLQRAGVQSCVWARAG